MMHFLRHRQPALTRILPHQANSRFLKTRGGGGRGLIGVFPSFRLNFEDLGAGAVNIVPQIGGVAGTFTRATPATTVNAAGLIIPVAAGVPRSFYDPTTLAFQGFFSEGGRVNLCPDSENFPAWTSTSVPGVVANSAIAPDGTMTADTLTDSDAGAFPGKNKVFTVANDALRHTFSVFVKKTVGVANTFGVNLNLSGGAPTLSASYRLNTNTGIVSAGSGSVKSYPDYWRLRGGLTNNASGNTTLTATVFPATSNNVGNNPGLDDAAAVGSAVVWGAQLEKADFASSYIPTGAVPVTRNLDTLLYPLLPWFNPVAGTMFLRATAPMQTGIAARALSLDDGTTAERILLYRETIDAWQTFVADGGVNVAGGSVGSWPQGATSKAALAYALNDYAWCRDGGAVGVDAAATVPTPTRLEVGGFLGTAQLFGGVGLVEYYPQRLTNAQLQALTA